MWNTSNILSGSRFVLTFPLSLALYNGNVVWIIVLTLIACATDFLDGYIARKYNQVTDLGKLVDPMADKFMVIGGAVSMLLAGSLPLFLFLTILVRDILILLGGIYIKKRYDVLLMSNTVGKYSVGIVALVLMLLAIGITEYKDDLIATAIGALIISFMVYVMRFVRIVANGNLDN